MLVLLLKEVQELYLTVPAAEVAVEAVDQCWERWEVWY
jgi:hypothetical protein